MMTFKSFIKGVWEFCSFVFVPQWYININVGRGMHGNSGSIARAGGKVFGLESGLRF